MLPKKRSPNIRPWIGVGALLILALLLSACQTAEPEVVIEEVTRIVEVEKEPSQNTPTPLPEQSDILAAWTGSPHGNTYDLGKGPNTYCSRCHSPQNWDPASTTSMLQIRHGRRDSHGADDGFRRRGRLGWHRL